MEKLSARALNRALLARQRLLAREPHGVLETVEHLVGLQSQVPAAPYTGLWTRLSGFDPEELSRLMTGRAAVRISTLRGTIHLHSAADALALRPLCQPVNDRGPYGRAVYRRALAGVEPERLAAVARELLADRPLTNAQLGAALLESFPGRDPSTLAWAVRDGLPLVQVPPRGLWGRSGQAASTTAEHWLGRPLEPDPSPDALVLRYLAAFGPAGVRDAQAWCGLTRLAEVFQRLRPGLRVFADAATGRELFDLPDAPRPDQDTPAPVRLLPVYDNAVLGHEDRARIVAAADLPLLAQGNGYRPAFLVDGRIRGTWALQTGRGAATLTLRPFAPLADADLSALHAEAQALLRFHTASDAPGTAPDAAGRVVLEDAPAGR
ncbi:winged helix DNA-binding domain-containing protein [Streptacidiphilus sp. PB12-B1b]|uniref:winged helix DNA-binding domain-containing protein n=1 Tax=Streptacidiphilus sp. PB12-B1b TaxID=2705012 RepID=UPI0015FBA58F|nr:winged helix DNA-binding domain-containing protein [Streptacidiphilus sp. PB12-B1b]QMU75339.1 winged helix DNA-binding domain-containing protein [Streptacidiphilus sp. PB12-B1b]